MACCACCCETKQGGTCCGEGDAATCCPSGQYCCGSTCQSSPCADCEEDTDCRFYTAYCAGAGEPGCGYGCGPLQLYYFPATASGLADALAYLAPHSATPECITCSVDLTTGRCCDLVCYPSLASLPVCEEDGVTCPP